MQKQTSGVSIVCVGHPYYGRMAFNLAKTIKAIDRNCPIQIITSGSALNPIRSSELWVFDEVTSTDLTNGFECKLHIDQLSVFENTLLLDADCAWVGNDSPMVLMNQLHGDGIKFTGITEGKYDVGAPESSDTSKKYYFWADIKEIVDQYSLKGEIYQWRSEFMYFEKCELTEKLFSLSREVYKDAPAKLKSLQLFAHHVPDELALNIAACLCEIGPHKYKWQPTFWSRLHNENIPSSEHLQSQYYALSCGSNVSSMNVKRLYDRIVKAASYKLGLQHSFPLISKRDMMPARQQM